MPPVQSVPSNEVDDDVAFKVLNQDGLPVSIVGESILRADDGQKQKPNVIVYPTRRPPNSLEQNKQRPFAKSHGQLYTKEPDFGLRKNYSVSQGDLPDEELKFGKTLDAKLRRLQKEEKLQSAARKADGSIKKPFVTVVKKGQFLEPPPEIACLLGLPVRAEEAAAKKEEKRLYAFESRPRVLNRGGKQGHKARCEAAARAAASIVGGVMGLQDKEFPKDVNCNISKKLADVPLPYANLMYDRRVVRGSNYAQNPMQTADGEGAAARVAEARRRALARRKAQQKQQTRGVQLRLGSPPPVPGRRHERVQTDQFLEEILNDPPAVDTCTQTDLFLQRPVSPFYVPAYTGADVETQIYPGDLFDFDMEVQPILEVLVGKTVEQALIEVLEEEELAALREQQRRFLEIRAAETAEAQRLAEREMRLRREKEERLQEHRDGLAVQQEMEERIAAAVLMQGYMADLLPSVLEGLEEEGFLTDNIKRDVDDSFMPWLMKEITHELKEIVSSRDVLAEMVKDILETRAEIYRALNRTPSSESVEEEGATGPTDDVTLAEHMKLKESFLAGEREHE